MRLLEGVLGSPHRIVAVVHTDDDEVGQESPLRNMGRRNSHYPNSLRKLGQEYDIQTVSFENNDINAPSSLDILRNFDATLFLVVQYPRIFDTAVIAIPRSPAAARPTRLRTGAPRRQTARSNCAPVVFESASRKACLNIHRGWPLRGGSIDQRAIYYKQTDYFVTLHRIDCGIDTGDILARQPVPIDWRIETGYSLDARVTEAGEKLIEDSLLPPTRLGTGDFIGIKQHRLETQYENKWKSERKVISPDEINYEDAERLARALHHPREEGLVVKIGSNLYRWGYREGDELISLKWQDRTEAALLTRFKD